MNSYFLLCVYGSEPYVTEDELKLMLRGAELSGAIEEEEQVWSLVICIFHHLMVFTRQSLIIQTCVCVFIMVCSSVIAGYD